MLGGWASGGSSGRPRDESRPGANWSPRPVSPSLFCSLGTHCSSPRGGGTSCRLRKGRLLSTTGGSQMQRRRSVRTLQLPFPDQQTRRYAAEAVRGTEGDRPQDKSTQGAFTVVCDRIDRGRATKGGEGKRRRFLCGEGVIGCIAQERG